MLRSSWVKPKLQAAAALANGGPASEGRSSSSATTWCESGLCQRRYKAYFRWSHYQFKLQPGLVLPEETEACASVTSAFLQVGLVHD
jgi:hypothetical protein